MSDYNQCLLLKISVASRNLIKGRPRRSNEIILNNGETNFREDVNALISM